MAKMSQYSTIPAAFCLFFSLGCAEGQSDQSFEQSSNNLKLIKQDSSIPIDFAALVNLLCNANAEPEILGVLKVEFDEKYDFREQRRIRKVIETLMVYAEEAWPELVKNLDRKEYAYTFGLEDSAVNFSVGEICEQIIRNNFSSSYIEASVVLEGSNLTLDDLNDPKLAEHDKLKSWLAERLKTPLVELQMQTLNELQHRIPTMKIEERRKSSLLEVLAEVEENLKDGGIPKICEWLIPLQKVSTYLAAKKNRLE